MTIIDAHCHLWEIERGDYGWLDPSNPTLAPLLRDFTVSDLQQLQQNNAIESSIVVQAAPSDAETDYLLSIAAQSNRIAAVIAWANLSDPACPERLAVLKQHPLCKGIRPMLQDIAETDWILGAVQQSNLATLSQLDLCFDALITPRHLPTILQTCHSHPDLSIIIDHAAKPCLAKITSHPAEYQQWAEGMALIGQETPAFCKISGLLTEMSTTQCSTISQIHTLLAPLFDQLLTWFGVERLVWGSDWPVLTLAASLDDWLEIIERLLSPLSAKERHAILKANAQRFYRLEAGVV